MRCSYLDDTIEALDDTSESALLGNVVEMVGICIAKDVTVNATKSRLS